MLLHLIESSRHRTWYSAPTLWSAGAHVLFAAAFVASAPGPGLGDGAASPNEVVYFLPLLPERAEPPRAEQLQWQGELPGQGVSPQDGFATLPVGGGESGRATGTEAAPFVATAPSDSGEANASPVYLEAELDAPVERDPMSAGPAYPEELRSKNVEGQVVAEWIVDTTGRADAGSFRVVESSHPLFSQAVRDVLPAMNFRPAELTGRRVRQLVRQQFRFVLQIEGRPTAAADSVRPNG